MENNSINPTDYLKKMRKRDELLAEYLGTNCPQVEMVGDNEKRRLLLILRRINYATRRYFLPSRQER